MTYKPGQTLSEVQICKELGISRSPVREALNWLTSEGLIIRVPGKGRVIPSLSLHDIGEIFAIKGALEGWVAQQAAEKWNEEDLRELKEALRCMEAAANEGNVDDWLAADRRFHDILFRIADNERVRQIINNLNEQWHRMRIGLITLEGRMLKSVSEHRLVLEAIESREKDRASVAILSHFRDIENTLTNLMEHFVLPYTRGDTT